MPTVRGSMAMCLLQQMRPVVTKFNSIQFSSIATGHTLVLYLQCLSVCMLGVLYSIALALAGMGPPAT